MAEVREIDGQTVLIDDEAVAVIRAIEKLNCQSILHANAERVSHFKRRLIQLGRDPKDVVVVLLNVDDVHGGPLAESLMPDHDWQQYRDLGQVPMARGLAVREGIQNLLDLLDKEAAEKLRAITTGVAVVVMDFGVAEVFDVGLPSETA